MTREEVDDFAIRNAMELESLRRQIHSSQSERHIPPEIAEQIKLELGEIGKAQDPPESIPVGTRFPPIFPGKRL